MIHKTFGFVGAGNIAGAIIGGVLGSVYITNDQIFVYDIDPQKIEDLSRYNIRACKDLNELAENSDYIILSVKPQLYQTVLSEFSEMETSSKIFISVAPGISVQKIQKMLKFEAKVIRTMPNTPLLLGEGATAIAENPSVSAEDFEIACGIFSSCGVVSVIDELQMDAVIAVNGSSPAYIFLMAKAVVEYADSQGIDPQAALALFAKTLKGSAKMLTESGLSPQQLIDMVKSPKGTTEAALNALDKYGFYGALQNGMDACTLRAKELGQVE